MRAPAADRFVLLGAVALPLGAGLAALLGPAFGYFPALGGTALSLTPMREVLAMPGLLQSALVSLVTALLATAMALCAVLLALAAFYGLPALARIERLLSPLLAVPHAATAFGLAFLIAPSGLLVRLISPELTGYLQPPDWPIPKDPYAASLILALIVKEIPFLFLVSLAALPLLPVARSRALAEGLGYGRIAGFLLLLGPQLYRRIRLPVLAVLVYSGSSIEMALILGPELPALLSVRVLRLMSDPDLGRFYAAAALALLQLATTGVTILIWLGLERMTSRGLRSLRARGMRFATDRTLRWMAVIMPLLSALIIAAGLASLALWSISAGWRFPDALPARLDTGLWWRIAPRIAGPLATSLVLGLAAALIALVLTLILLFAQERHGRGYGLPALVFLPLVIPDVVFLFGLQLASLRLGLAPGILTVLFAHLVVVLPYVALSLEGPWRAYDRRYDRLAESLGKSPLRIFFTIRLRMLARPLVTALAVGFAVSAGLYLPTLLMGGGRVTTITTEAVSLASGGDRRLIGAYALLQALLPFLGFTIANMLQALLWRPQRARKAGP